MENDVLEKKKISPAGKTPAKYIIILKKT